MLTAIHTERRADVLTLITKKLKMLLKLKINWKVIKKIFLLARNWRVLRLINTRRTSMFTLQGISVLTIMHMIIIITRMLNKITMLFSNKTIISQMMNKMILNYQILS